MIVQTGIKCVDKNVGGISPETITLIYGEAETGKTTFAMQCAANCAQQGNKTLFADCDNTFYTKRLAQISGDKFDQIAEQIILVKPKDFKEQTALIDNVQDYTAKNFGLIVFDTLTSLYGAKVSERQGKAFSVNRELNRQLAILAQTAKIRKIPIIITSQVRAAVDNEQDYSVRPVATRVLKFWADNIIALKPTQYPQIVKAVLEKTTQNTQEITCYIQIVEGGILDAQMH